MLARASPHRFASYASVHTCTTCKLYHERTFLARLSERNLSIDTMSYASYTTALVWTSLAAAANTQYGTKSFDHTYTHLHSADKVTWQACAYLAAIVQVRAVSIVCTHIVTQQTRLCSCHNDFAFSDCSRNISVFLDTNSDMLMALPVPVYQAQQQHFFHRLIRRMPAAYSIYSYTCCWHNWPSPIPGLSAL